MSGLKQCFLPPQRFVHFHAVSCHWDVTCIQGRRVLPWAGADQAPELDSWIHQWGTLELVAYLVQKEWEERLWWLTLACNKPSLNLAASHELLCHSESYSQTVSFCTVREMLLRFFPAQNIKHILQICLHLEISFKESKFLGTWVKSVGNERQTPTNIEY